MAYKTPGVYVKEVSIFPPSVAEVETAIPAFIGYTEKAEQNGQDLTNVPTKVRSILEFNELFGGDFGPGSIEVTLDGNNTPQRVDIVPRYYLYKSLRLFFANGGGECYIVSVGRYGDDIELGDPADPAANPGLLVGLTALKKYDEPTIILFPDAVLMETAGDFSLYSLQQAALAQCNDLGDRVAVFDLLEQRRDAMGAINPAFDWEDGVNEFRNQIGVNSLKYGTAYTPYLKTTIPYEFGYTDISLRNQLGPVTLQDLSADPAPVNDLEDALADVTTIQDFIADPLGSGDSLMEGFDNLTLGGGLQNDVNDMIDYVQDVIKEIFASSVATNLRTTLNRPKAQAALDAMVEAKTTKRIDFLIQAQQDYYSDPTSLDNSDPQNVIWGGGQPESAVITTVDPADPDYAALSLATPTPAATPGQTIYGDDPAASAQDLIDNAQAAFRQLVQTIVNDLNALAAEAEKLADDLEKELLTVNSIYANVVRAINTKGSTLPPSGAVAGLYAYVDNNRGVWKAPANVSVSSVTGPTVIIDDELQEDLNVDVNAGKSINAIRAFTGKGTLVWGARTLAGNDNEWRYISVRRFFNMVEESVKKSTGWAVFEPNDATTWGKVRSMISNYLLQKWKEGALQGATPDDAFFVKVGLGLTMTYDDILNGIMKVEIGMAVVRPAEFIILSFSHKMVENA